MTLDIFPHGEYCNTTMAKSYSIPFSFLLLLFILVFFIITCHAGYIPCGNLGNCSSCNNKCLRSGCSFGRCEMNKCKCYRITFPPSPRPPVFSPPSQPVPVPTFPGETVQSSGPSLEPLPPQELIPPSVQLPEQPPSDIPQPEVPLSQLPPLETLPPPSK